MWKFFISFRIVLHKSGKLTKGVFYGDDTNDGLNDYIDQNSVFNLVLEAALQGIKESEKTVLGCIRYFQVSHLHVDHILRNLRESDVC